jgi:hypothetical protein
MSFTALSPTANHTNPSKGCSYSGAFEIVFYVADLREKQKIALTNSRSKLGPSKRCTE